MTPPVLPPVPSLPTPPSLPAACANCIERTIPSLPGANLIQLAIQQFRSLEGKLRIDFGMTSLIINPLNQLRILLDHVAMEARILIAEAHLPGMPQMPQIPHFGMPQVPNPGAEVAKLEQLGMAVIQGLEAEGMRYLFAPGGFLTSWEIWTSTLLKIPILTRTIGTFGERLCICNCNGVQPPASMFEIPPGYTIINPSAPQLQVPSAPQVQMPTAPQVQMPSAPQMPTAPQFQMPPAPQMPAAPQMPSAPPVPSAPQVQVPSAPQVQVPSAPQVQVPSAPQVQITPVPKIG
jgi:hypothetical protein